MLPTEITVRLSTGHHVTLTCWSEVDFEAHAADLLAYVVEFGDVLAQGSAPRSIPSALAATLRRVVRSAMRRPPERLPMRDLGPLALAVWELNGMDDWLRPLMALASKALTANARARLSALNQS